MRVSKIGAAIALMGLAGAFGVASAAPASALSTVCSGIDGLAFSGVPAVQGVSGSFEAGEVLTVTWTDLSNSGTTVTLEIPNGGTVVDSRTGAGSVSYTFPSNITTTWASRLTSGTGRFVISCGVAAASPVVEDQTPAPIPSWVQAYGRQQDEKCQEGWEASWQSWAEPVTGGWVCTRSIPSLG